MTSVTNLLDVRVDLKAIRANYSLLQARSAGQGLLAVIKADAYGHGLVEVARALNLSGARNFAVGTVEEAGLLRDAGIPGRILSLLGPQDMREAKAVAGQNILPLIYREEQLHLLAEATAGRRQPIAIKLDTGMRRLGFAVDEVSRLCDVLSQRKTLEPVLVMSHLAAADDPAQAAFTREQAARFEVCRNLFHSRGMKVEWSLCNSAGLLAWPDFRYDWQRPGIALYGANPFHGTPLAEKGAGLEQAMTVSAPVIQVHALRQGESIGYGRTFVADADLRVAIVAVGYADCLSRHLSNAGWCCLHGRRARMLGRVSMQMIALDVTAIPETTPGDRAWILGGEGEGAVSAHDLAGWWGTIPYEVFCVLGKNRRG